MIILMKKFGQVLTSRQSGKEAYSAFLPILSNIKNNNKIVIDFEGVNVLSPSWADEFLTPLLERFGKRLKLIPSQNASVKLTIKTIEDILGQHFLLER